LTVNNHKSKEMRKVKELPMVTKHLIRMLPTFTTSDPITLENFLLLPINNNKTVKHYLQEIVNNIEQTKKVSAELADELTDQLEIQLMIIQHGYKGVK
jgi:hypothetical protein